MKLPQNAPKGIDVIGIDSYGHEHYVFRCNCNNPHCEEWRCSISGSNLMTKIVKWKSIAFVFVFLTCQIMTAQNAFLFGELIDSDSTRIEIWHDGQKIVDKYITDIHYALQLGARTHYTIKFSSEGRVKYMHVMNVGYYPEKIETDIDFRRHEHAIVYKSQETKRGTNMLIYRSRRIIDKAKF